MNTNCILESLPLIVLLGAGVGLTLRTIRHWKELRSQPPDRASTGFHLEALMVLVFLCFIAAVIGATIYCLGRGTISLWTFIITEIVGHIGLSILECAHSRNRWCFSQAPPRYDKIVC